MNNLLPDNDDVLVFAQPGGWQRVGRGKEPPRAQKRHCWAAGRGLTDGIRLLDRDRDVQAIVERSRAAFVRVWTRVQTFEPEWLANFSTIWREAIGR